VFISSQ